MKKLEVAMQCPRGPHGLAVKTEDQYGPYYRCPFCGWTDNGLDGSEPFVKRVAGARNEGPYLPKGPSNFQPWRERERVAWLRGG
mgnify:CR=1 FL=1